jgi:hypothetical protein
MPTVTGDRTCCVHLIGCECPRDCVEAENFAFLLGIKLRFLAHCKAHRLLLLRLGMEVTADLCHCIAHAQVEV